MRPPVRARGSAPGLARGLPLRYLGEVWASWTSGQQPTTLLVLGDCPAKDPDDGDEACLLFNGHAGAHSWCLTDPDEDGLRQRLDAVPAQPAGAVALAARSAIQRCEHLRTEKCDGKTYCARCKRQIYL